MHTPERTQGLETTTPVTQDRDKAMYCWAQRHEAVLARNREVSPDVVLFGDSLIHYWGGEPRAPLQKSVKTWDACFAGYSVTNLGFGWDRTENVLWRIENGELDGIRPRGIVIKIGTNNIGVHSAEEIVAGIEAVCAAAHEKQPRAHILLLGILPRLDEKGIQFVPRINRMLAARYANGDPIRFRDMEAVFQTPDSDRDGSLYSDYIHINERGYERLGARLREEILALLNAADRGSV